MKKTLLLYTMFVLATMVTYASAVKYDNGIVNGENITDDTIDEDSIDFGTGTDQVSASDMPDEDIGDVSIVSGSYTLDSGVVDSTALADDVTVSSIIVVSTMWNDNAGKIDGEQIADDTIDDDSIDLATGAGVSATDMPDEDVGDMSIVSGSWTLDSDVVDSAALADEIDISTITTTGNSICLKGDYVHIGDGGTLNYAGAEGTLYINGNGECDGIFYSTYFYAVTGLTIPNTATVDNNAEIVFGSGNDSCIGYDTSETKLRIGLGNDCTTDANIAFEVNSDTATVVVNAFIPGQKTEAELKAYTPVVTWEIWTDTTNKAVVISTGTGAGDFGQITDGTQTPTGW